MFKCANGKWLSRVNGNSSTKLAPSFFNGNQIKGWTNAWRKSAEALKIIWIKIIKNANESISFYTFHICIPINVLIHYNIIIIHEFMNTYQQQKNVLQVVSLGWTRKKPFIHEPSTSAKHYSVCIACNGGWCWQKGDYPLFVNTQQVHSMHKSSLS